MKGTLLGKALFLSWFTIGYNVLEGVLSILAGMLAGSVALVGFGLDSFVESLSGGVMVWRLARHGELSGDEHERKEQRALRLIGGTFFVFAAYVLVESGKKLLLHEAPDPSLFGIIIAVASIVVMPALYVRKVQVARALGLRSLEADAKETLACMYLSVALLAGLGLNYRWGWWWADPLAGLMVVFFLVREGMEVFEEETEEHEQ